MSAGDETHQTDPTPHSHEMPSLSTSQSPETPGTPEHLPASSVPTPAASEPHHGDAPGTPAAAVPPQGNAPKAPDAPEVPRAVERTEPGGSVDAPKAPDNGELPSASELPKAAVEPELPTVAAVAEVPAGHGQVEPAAGAGRGARVVRQVVCSYRLGLLPGDWLQTWRRLERLFARTGLQVKATLAPLEDLPADTDILVVPPELRAAAREAAMPNTPILVTPASAAAEAFAELVSRLEAGTEFTAARTDPADKDRPKLLSYRGHSPPD
jgi:hypothetical protein